MDNPNLNRNPFWHRIRRRQPIPTTQTPVLPRPPRRPISSILTLRRPPIHERPLAVNLQSSCPLYSTIPPEIRDEIFQYALAEYTKTDAESLYPESTNYTRPGYTGKRAVSTSLLQTCRRAYLETYHLPLANKEHVFWHERWPPGAITHEANYFARFAPWQLKMVKEIHLFTQLFWLEGSFPHLCKESFMQGIERVKITIRRGDWWWNERNEKLGINPQRGNGDVHQMHRDWASESSGQVIPFRDSGWGSAFARLSSLKELEIEFETTIDKKAELLTITSHAKSWRFPFKTNKVLNTDNMPVTTTTWQGPLCYWSPTCPYCGSSTQTCGRSTSPFWSKGCEEKRRLREQGKGPECVVVSLNWRVGDA